MTALPHPISAPHEPVLNVALVGFGAMGQALAALLHDDAPVSTSKVLITQVIVTARSKDKVARLVQTVAPHARVLTELDMAGPGAPALLAECAGHHAVTQHVIPALRSGLPCVVASVGALHDAQALAALEHAARAGGTRVRLVAGAVGGIDALLAARVGGLDSVHYTGRKPPLSWRDTPAEAVCDLPTLRAPCVIFEGSARQAAVAFPRNANVAATIGLAGLGLDETRVTLIADPGVQRNTHTLVATGRFGRLQMDIENLPLPDNPKTSAQAVYSVANAVRQAAAPVSF